MLCQNDVRPQSVGKQRRTSFASLGECDRIASDTAKSIKHSVTATSLRYLICYPFWRYAIPPLLIEQTSLMVQ